ncbi:MAG: ATP-binding protein [Methylocystis sp.]|jgi:signal transduction histidine kinase
MVLSDFIRRLRPDHLLGQITLLILGSIVVYQMVIVLLLHVMESEGRRHYVSEADFLTGVLLALDSAPVSERRTLIQKIHFAAPYTGIVIRDDKPAALETSDPIFESEIRRINAHLIGAAKAFETTPLHNMQDTLALPLEKGGYAVVSVAQHRKPSRLLWRWFSEPEEQYPIFMSRWGRLGFLFFISASVILIWLSNYIIAPLDDLARRAESFPTKADFPWPLIDRGPREIRDLTRSIRAMKARILAMVAERTQILAAVSHDLKTIITRLSLRTEFIEDDRLRWKMQKDIRVMDAMLRKNLEYLRTENPRVDHSAIALDSVIHTVVDEFNDLGCDVVYRCDKQHTTIRGSLSDMQRIFTNLVENATHHAKRVEIVVSEVAGNMIQIDVADDGPGVPDELKAKMFEPFVRGDTARTLGEHGGFGLGLAIVRSLVEGHGGAVQMLDRAPHGLIVRVILPRDESVLEWELA